MDYLTSSTKALYRKYLIASLGSALVITIYSFVDTIAVGQSEGPAGTAAMAGDHTHLRYPGLFWHLIRHRRLCSHE